MIKKIQDGKLIFVFGSNRAGVHGAGAAKFACEKMGAVMGKGDGLYGQSYALPTKGIDIKPLPLYEVKVHVDGFFEFAKKDTSLKYQVTRVGCGLGGLKDHEVAPMFRDAPPNVILPGVWRSLLNPKIKIIAPVCSQDVNPEIFAEEVLSFVQKERDAATYTVLSAQEGTPEAAQLTKLEASHDSLVVQIIVPNTQKYPRLSEAQRLCEETLLWLSSDMLLVGPDSDQRLNKLAISAKDKSIRVQRINVEPPQQLDLLGDTPLAPLGLHYTGIGSREAPKEILDEMRKIARTLGEKGYTLRSGAANGADTAFELGCDDVKGKKEIWLPWKGFNDHPDTGLYPNSQMTEIASAVHPAWNALGQGPRKLHARNVGQVLGGDCGTPSKLLICWTPDGCETAAARSKVTGGTATAIAIADHNRVPIFNLKNPESRVGLYSLLESLPEIHCSEIAPGVEDSKPKEASRSIGDQAKKLIQKKKQGPSF